jgi:hypothetical protein
VSGTFGLPADLGHDTANKIDCRDHYRQAAAGAMRDGKD